MVIINNLPNVQQFTKCAKGLYAYLVNITTMHLLVLKDALKYRQNTADCRLSTTQCTLHNAYYTVHITQYTEHST